MIELYLSKLLLLYPHDSFYYNDLRRFYYSKSNPLPKTYDWHTIERAIRKFAETGLLYREKRGRKVIFFINKEKIRDLYYKLKSTLE